MTGSGIRVAFTGPRGAIVAAEAEPGDNLLRVGQAHGLPLEGTCSTTSRHPA